MSYSVGTALFTNAGGTQLNPAEFRRRLRAFLDRVHDLGAEHQIPQDLKHARLRAFAISFIPAEQLLECLGEDPPDWEFVTEAFEDHSRQLNDLLRWMDQESTQPVTDSQAQEPSAVPNAQPKPEREDLQAQSVIGSQARDLVMKLYNEVYVLPGRLRLSVQAFSHARAALRAAERKRQALINRVNEEQTDAHMKIALANVRPEDASVKAFVELQSLTESVAQIKRDLESARSDAESAIERIHAARESFMNGMASRSALKHRSEQIKSAAGLFDINLPDEVSAQLNEIDQRLASVDATYSANENLGLMEIDPSTSDPPGHIQRLFDHQVEARRMILHHHRAPGLLFKGGPTLEDAVANLMILLVDMFTGVDDVTGNKRTGIGRNAVFKMLRASSLLDPDELTDSLLESVFTSVKDHFARKQFRKNKVVYGTNDECHAQAEEVWKLCTYREAVFQALADAKRAYWKESYTDKRTSF